jgi:hypothetical protein
MGVKRERCPECGQPLAGGRGGVGYCPPPKTCRENARRKQIQDGNNRHKLRYPRGEERLKHERAWRAEQAQGISRRQLGKLFLIVAPASIYTNTLQHAEAFAELQTIQNALVNNQRKAADLGARQIRARLEGDNSACAHRIRAHCAHVLRDVGGPDFRQVESQARLSEKEWATQKDYVHVSWAMLCRAQLYKQQGRLRDSMDLIDDVFAILEGSCCDADSSSVALVRHQALRWRTRILAIDQRELDRARPFMKLLRQVTTEIPSLSTHLQTLTEDIGYRSHWRQFDKAELCLQEAKQLAAGDSIPYYSVAHTSLLRSEIGLRLAEGRRTAAVGLVEEHFTVWKCNPNAHQLRSLQGIREACGLPLIRVHGTISTYCTGILPSYQQPTLTKL